MCVVKKLRRHDINRGQSSVRDRYARKSGVKTTTMIFWEIRPGLKRSGWPREHSDKVYEQDVT